MLKVIFSLQEKEKGFFIHLIIVVVTMKERLLPEDHAGEHAT